MWVPCLNSSRKIMFLTFPHLKFSVLAKSILLFSSSNVNQLWHFCHFSLNVVVTLFSTLLSPSPHGNWQLQLCLSSSSSYPLLFFFFLRPFPSGMQHHVLQHSVAFPLYVTQSHDVLFEGYGAVERQVRGNTLKVFFKLERDQKPDQRTTCTRTYCMCRFNSYAPAAC